MKKKMAWVGKIVGYIVAAFVSALGIFPLIWMFLAGFKSKREVVAVPLKLLPTEWHLENYVEIFEGGLLQSMAATLSVACVGTVLAVLVNLMAGYVFARMEFYGKKYLWGYCLIPMFVPGITTLLTSYIMVYNLGILNTYWVLLLPGIAGGGSIFFYRQFFLNMPLSLEDAARIDGCDRFAIFVKISIPNAKAAIVVNGIGCFMGYWNNFLWPSLTISGNSRWVQIMQLIRSFQSEYSTEYGKVLAASTIAIIPPLIIFFIFQKQLVKGFVLSGLK